MKHLIRWWLRTRKVGGEVAETSAVSGRHMRAVQCDEGGAKEKRAEQNRPLKQFSDAAWNSTRNYVHRSDMDLEEDLLHRSKVLSARMCGCEAGG